MAKPKDRVALILAVGLAISVNIITFAIVLGAVSNDARLSENGTQILTAAFGGIIGLLGSYLGYRASSNVRDKEGREDGTQGSTSGDDGRSP